MPKYKVGSLFAGVGGICLGFKQASYFDSEYEIIWANEIDKFAAETYNRNFNHKLIVGDIEKIVNPNRCESDEERLHYLKKQDEITESKIDILVGGFPCQAFSIAGERKGFDDHRGNLFFSIVDLITILEKKYEKPRVLMLENVKNLQSHDDGNTYKVIKGKLNDMGYIVKEAVLNTMEFSEVPQNRERIFIVCFLNESDAARFTMFDKDEKGNYINLSKYRKSISDNERIKRIKEIIDYESSADILGDYYYTKEKYPQYFLSEEEYNSIEEVKKKEVRINLEEQIDDFYEFYQVRRGMYVRKNKKGVCPTLTANMGTGGHNVPLIKVKDGVRKLTPEETFKLQGFPVGSNYELPKEVDGKKFANSYLYKQAGNAVTVPVIKMIAEEILKALENK